MTPPPVELLVPLILVALGFLAFCWYDLWKVDHTRYLPKWAWAVICAVSVPGGGIIYLLIGRAPKYVTD